MECENVETRRRESTIIFLEQWKLEIGAKLPIDFIHLLSDIQILERNMKTLKLDNVATVNVE